MEIGRRAEALDEIQTLLAPVPVKDGHRDFLHVECDGIPKRSIKRAASNHQCQTPGIPVDMNKLFFRNGPGTGEFQSLSSFSIKETKTSSSEGLIVPILLRRIHAFRIGQDLSLQIGAFLPITWRPSPKTADSKTQVSSSRDPKQE